MYSHRRAPALPHYNTTTHHYAKFVHAHCLFFTPCSVYTWSCLLCIKHLSYPRPVEEPDGCELLTMRTRGLYAFMSVS
jgi:hypothetical protein